MKTKNELYEQLTDKSGETYYCPLGTAAKTGNRADSEACVEGTTVERYAGNLTVVS